MTRKKPNIYVGNTVKKRDRLSFKDFVIGIVEDTFINEFTPTSSSLDGELFSVILGPVDNSDPNDGDFDDDVFDVTGSFVQDTADIEGYRFVYEDLQVDTTKDYIDIYLYGVRQPIDKYDIEVYKYEASGSSQIPIAITGSVVGMQEIRFVFNESITRVPEDVVITDWDIKGKIKEIE